VASGTTARPDGVGRRLFFEASALSGPDGADHTALVKFDAARIGKLDQALAL
jgi:hypothetical protein